MQLWMRMRESCLEMTAMRKCNYMIYIGVGAGRELVGLTHDGWTDGYDRL